MYWEYCLIKYSLFSYILVTRVNGVKTDHFVPLIIVILLQIIFTRQKRHFKLLNILK